MASEILKLTDLSQYFLLMGPCIIIWELPQYPSIIQNGTKNCEFEKL